MKKEEYLKRLKTQLKTLPQGKQIELLEEVSCHLDDILSDSTMGKSDIDKEMGIPEELGRRLCQIHRQRRWIDFLFVLLPAWLISPLSSWIICLFLHENMGSLRNNSMAITLNHYLFIFFCFSLVLIGLRRYFLFDTPQLAVYWILETWWGIVTLNMSQQRWTMSGLNSDAGTIIETIFWVVLLILLGYALIRLMLRSRDLSVVVLGAISFTIATANVISIGQYSLIGYHLPSWNIGFIHIHQIVLIVWTGLFFLFQNRNIRWAGLLINAAYVSLLNGLATYNYPGLLALWSLPTLTVVTGYLIEHTLYSNPKNLLRIRRN